MERANAPPRINLGKRKANVGWSVVGPICFSIAWSVGYPGRQDLAQDEDIQRVVGSERSEFRRQKTDNSSDFHFILIVTLNDDIGAEVYL